MLVKEVLGSKQAATLKSGVCAHADRLVHTRPRQFLYSDVKYLQTNSSNAYIISNIYIFKYAKILLIA